MPPDIAAKELRFSGCRDALCAVATRKCRKGLLSHMVSTFSEMVRSTDWLSCAEALLGPGGLLPTPVQKKRLPDCFPFFVYGMDLPSDLRDRLSEADRRFPAGGASTRKQQARAAAIAEGLERLMFVTWHPSRSLSTVIDRSIEISSEFCELPFLIPPEQSPERFLHDVWNDNEIGWCLPDMLSTGEPLAVPTGLVSGAIPAKWEQTTNGIACGGTATEARLHALLEVIERDTMMIAWYSHLHGCELPMEAFLAPDLYERVTRFDRRKTSIVLRGYMSDIGIPVVVAAILVGGKDTPQGAAVGTAAAATFHTAATRAATEAILAWTGLWAQPDRAEPPPRRGLVPVDFSGHLLYYQTADRAAHLSQWLSPIRGGVGDVADVETGRSLNELLDRLHEVGYRALFFDMTSPDIKSLGLHISRAIVPRLVPMSVGNWHGRHLHRLADPPPFLLGDRLPGEGEGNAGPHPFP